MNADAKISTQTDLESLVAAAQLDPTNDGQAMNEIVRRFQPLAMALAGRLTRNLSFHDDIVQAAVVGLLEAVRHHNPTRARFAGYARVYMRGAARRELRFLLQLDVASTSTPDVSTAVSSIQAPAIAPGMYSWGHGAVAMAVQTLTESQQRLLQLRYIDDAPIAVIATLAGTSVSAVSQRLATAHRSIATTLAA
jgi:RNA polymerase sigma factor (sigma-70 family)